MESRPQNDQGICSSLVAPKTEEEEEKEEAEEMPLDEKKKRKYIYIFYEDSVKK